MRKWIAQLTLGRLHTYLDGLTEEDLKKIAEMVNKRIGGDKKVEFESLKIVVQIVRVILDTVRF